MQSNLLEARSSGHIAVLYEGQIMKGILVEEADERLLGLLMDGIAETAQV